MLEKPVPVRYHELMKSPKEKEIKADLPKPLEPAVNEAERIVKDTLRQIEKRLDSPVGEATDATAKLTTASELKTLLKNASREQAKIALNGIENIVLGGIALVPLLGEAEGGAIAAAELTDAAILEGATKAQAAALARGATVTAGGEVAYPLAKIIGQEGAKRLTKVLKAIDPFPDVPTVVTLASGGAELMGAHGAAAIPSAVQILVDQYKSMRLGAQTALEAGRIILRSPEAQRARDFGQSVLSSVQTRLNAAQSPRMSQAAAAFA